MQQKIDKKEVWRYLGYRGGAQPDDETAQVIDECIGQVAAAAVPKYALAWVPVVFDQNEPDTLLLGDMRVASKNLCRHLQGCHEAAVFAATVGIGVDRLIKRAAVTGMARTAMLQAAGAAAVEAVCDDINGQIRLEAGRRGCLCKTRYSPGFGDFKLSHQPEVLGMLNAAKKAGITLTDGYLMIPSKSVTAVIGIYKEAVKDE